MGRYGNVMLVNGQTDYALEVARGEVVRLYLTNTANVRPFNVRIPGARMKLVGGDGGRVEREQFVDEVLIAPVGARRRRRALRASRAVPTGAPHAGAGLHPRDDHGARGRRSSTHMREEFATLRTDPELVAERARLGADLARPPDKTLALVP